MIINLQPGTKCSLCNSTFVIDSQVKYYVDESGYVRISHIQCYIDKYEAQ